jgi:hypothetical protein
MAKATLTHLGEMEDHTKGAFGSAFSGFGFGQKQEAEPKAAAVEKAGGCELLLRSANPSHCKSRTNPAFTGCGEKKLPTLPSITRKCFVLSLCSRIPARLRPPPQARPNSLRLHHGWENPACGGAPLAAE